MGERQAELRCAGEGNRKAPQTQLKDKAQWGRGSAIGSESVRRKKTLILSIDNLGLHGKEKSLQVRGACKQRNLQVTRILERLGALLLDTPGSLSPGRFG